MENKLLKVTNRSKMTVGYAIPDSTIGQERFFQVGETKDIEFEELRKLSWTPGGMNLIKNYLVIHNDEAVQEILGDVEPEYFYSAEETKKILMEGSLEQLLDTLDFATDGVIDLIKTYAVELEVPDTRKRAAIKDRTGLDIDLAIINKKAMEEEEPVKENEKVRRTATPAAAETEKTPARRVATASSKYNVVSRG